MIGKFALSLASLALSATVLAAQTSTTPPTVKPATQVTKAPGADPGGEAGDHDGGEAGRRHRDEVGEEGRQVREEGGEEVGQDREEGREGRCEAGEEGRSHEADDGHVNGTGGKACRSEQQQVGEGPSARQRTGCGISPEASPAPLRAIGGALLLMWPGSRGEGDVLAAERTVRSPP